MRLRKRTVTGTVVLLAGLLAMPLFSQTAHANETTKLSKKVSEPAESDNGEVSLVIKQGSIARRYKGFEKTLRLLHEYMLKTDRPRAELLRRALGRSQEDRIAQQMEQIAAVLKREQFGNAIERQVELVTHLKALLDLLQSEDRKSEIEKEKQRIKDLLKDLRKLIGKEKDIRAGTERGRNAARLANQQQKVAKEAKGLENKIDAQDAERNGQGKDAKGGKAKEGKGQDGKGKDGKSKDGKDQDQDGEQKDGKETDGQSKDDQGKDGQGKSGEGKSGEGKSGEGKSGEGKSGEGKSGEGQSGENQSDENQSGDSEPSNRTPGRKELEQARREMERAIQELKRQNHDGASAHQDEAIKKLLEFKEKLEEILRQLREEERELLLAALEARFQKMLVLQILVYQGTIILDKTPQKEWTSRHFSRSRELAQQEGDIALEASKALTLLREEGSSVAFPEAVEQLREDILTVAHWLERAEVGQLTQSTEQDIIEALEEIIEALQREMEKLKKKKQQQQQQQQGQPADQALVDKLAELKMLRTLQLRVNRRTKRLGRLVRGEQATEADVVDELQKLSKRQYRIQEVTYDLATGKNR
jgi:hypothetical protein